MIDRIRKASQAEKELKEILDETEGGTLSLEGYSYRLLYLSCRLQIETLKRVQKIERKITQMER